MTTALSTDVRTAKPRRHGDRYCATWCGGGCTWAAYLDARRRAMSLAKQLGRGWVPRVWENLGWWWSAVSRDGRVKVHGHVHRDRVSYTAFIGADATPGGRFTGDGTTPQRALAAAVRDATREMGAIAALLQGFEYK